LTQECLSDLGIESTVEGSAVSTTLKYGQVPLITLARPDKEVFRNQVGAVLERRADRADRMPEIMTQVTPQFAFWASICNLHPERNRHTIELSLVLLHVAMLLIQRFKHELACPRPAAWSVDMQPPIQTPAYFAWPSGHATESLFFAAMMARLRTGVPGQNERLHKLALRIAENREVAGLHFPVDSAAGQFLGHRLAEYFAARAGGPGVPIEMDCLTCNGNALGESTTAVSCATNEGIFLCDGGAITPAATAPKVSVKKSAMLAWLWMKARQEKSY
jgi:hypothetical protein